MTLRPKLSVVISVSVALVMGMVGGAVAASAYKWHYINEGQGAQFRGLNVNCDYVPSGDQVICGGRNVTALAVFTFTGVRIEKARGNEFVTTYRTRRCCG